MLPFDTGGDQINGPVPSLSDHFRDAVTLFPQGFGDLMAFVFRDNIDLFKADGKPLLNTESYLAGPIGHRYEEFKRLLWSGVAEGVSLQNLWQWAGYWPAETTMTIKYLIQHPQVTSPESWDGIKAAQAEIDEVADIFLPRSNRERAKVAALFSYPSLRMNEKSANGFTLGCETMRVLNIPFDAIFEEQLAQDRQDRYSVLLALGARHVAPASIDALERWVKDGGVLVADGDSLRGLARRVSG